MPPRLAHWELHPKHASDALSAGVSQSTINNFVCAASAAVIPPHKPPKPLSTQCSKAMDTIRSKTITSYA
eukprot:2455745-Amphidinium_carterae.1